MAPSSSSPIRSKDRTAPFAPPRRMNDESPGKFFYADQYNNAFNWRSHYDTTGPEIIRQTGGRLTHFVAGLGTSGTFVGVGRRLRELATAIVLVSVQPDSPLHGLEGLKHMESAIVPGIYDPTLADQDVRVGTEEAYDMTRRLAQEEGLLVGISSGANLAGALKVAARTTRSWWWCYATAANATCRSASGRTRPKGRSSAARIDGAGVDPDGGCGDSGARPRGVSARVLRRAARPRSRGAGGLRAAEHHRRRPAPAVPGAARGLSRRGSSARATRGLDLLGFYHSHPDHPAQPSQFDLDHAWPSFSYVIVSVMARRRPGD